VKQVHSWEANICLVAEWIPQHIQSIFFRISLLLPISQVSCTNSRQNNLIFSCIPLNTARIGLQNNTQTLISYLTGTQPLSITETNNLTLYILYKKMNVCLYVTYANPHFWTDLNQTLRTYSTWSGGGRRICMDPHYSTFPPFQPISSGASADSYAIYGCRRQTPPLLRYNSGAERDGVTSRAWRTLCVMHWKCGEVNGMHVCENGNLMRRVKMNN
jgi:hypothetical protein